MNHRGITLLETVVWIGIFTFAMTAVSQSVLYFFRTSTYSIQQSTAVSSTQRGIDSTVRSIREAAYSNVGAFPVVAISTSSFTYYANTDTDSSVEQVHYYVSGTTLYLGIIEPTGDPAQYTGTEVTSVVSDNIKNISQNVNLFTYYDAAGAQISDFTRIGSVRFVTVNLVADIDPNRAPTFITLRSSAALRNLVN